MFGRLVRKELAGYFTDLRFTVVFALCILLAAVSVYTGSRNYVRQLQEHSETMASHRRTLASYVENRQLSYLRVVGERWNYRPEVLSPLAYGLSGTIGQEAFVQFQASPRLEVSTYEGDPIYSIFGMLDLSFIVKVILSVSALLFTYDVVCGEKQSGTLRLVASFPVSRATLAASKMVGATVAVLVPYSLSFLIAAAVLALVPEIDLRSDDWLRVVAMLMIFALYLAVFCAFGLFISSVTHQRLTAFLSLLVLWAAWIFVVPDMSVTAVKSLAAGPSSVAVRRQADKLLWEMEAKAHEEVGAYWDRHQVDDWEGLPEATRRELAGGESQIRERWDAQFYPRLARIGEAARNRARRHLRVASILSSASPYGAATLATTALACTGYHQKELVEDALANHLVYMAGYIRQKQAVPWPLRPELTDYTPFAFRTEETLRACLSRIVPYILNLALLAVLGFAGAYVGIVRYDVR